MYLSGEARLELDGEPITITQETRYPVDGQVKITLGMEQETHVTLGLRISGWCRKATLAVNGEAVELNEELLQHGYAKIERDWKNGDHIELNFDMPVEMMQAHPLVRENAGKVALMRGPQVFCLEEVDNKSNLSSHLPASERDTDRRIRRKCPGRKRGDYRQGLAN